MRVSIIKWKIQMILQLKQMVNVCRLSQMCYSSFGNGVIRQIICRFRQNGHNTHH